jgi:hypothetical protein
LTDTATLNLHSDFISGVESAAAGTTVRVVSPEDGVNNVVVGNQAAAAGSFTNVTLSATGGLRTSTTATNTALLQAYDTLGLSYTTFGTLIAGNPPAFDLASTVTIGGNYIYRVGGTDVAVSDGGTGLSSYTDGQLLIGNSTGNTLNANTLTAGTNISITNGAGSITINALAGSAVRTYTPVNTTPYVALTTDDILGVDTSALAITIRLPNAPTTGSVWQVKDVTGSAATRNITVTSVGGAIAFDSAATSYVMNVDYASASFMFNGVKYLVL